jgi:predicted nucleic acid binding AN1-type Zn finger protein
MKTLALLLVEQTSCIQLSANKAVQGRDENFTLCFELSARKNTKEPARAVQCKTHICHLFVYSSYWNVYYVVYSMQFVDPYHRVREGWTACANCHESS